MLGLDAMLHPGAVSARVTLAGFHAADDVVYKSEEGGWLVLAGDAACGRPFYLGSTLNGQCYKRKKRRKEKRSCVCVRACVRA